MGNTILITEDNQFTAMQYSKILSQHGHKVEVARDGEECIQKFQTGLNTKNYDYVILDHNLPKKKGAEVASEIFSLKENQKVIFASAYALSCEKNYSSLKDKVKFLQKPFSLTQLVEAIK